VLAGADAYTTNPVEAICKALANGDDPAGTTCVQCGAAAPAIYRCTAICEESHAKRTADRDSAVRWLLLPIFVNMMLWFHHQEEEIDRQGHDVEVSFNLPVCDACARPVGNVLRPAVARQFLLRVPVYRELLEFYPNLKLKIDASQNAAKS
jgi:hypothetical protein